DINLTTAVPVRIELPGYVAVPQGRFVLNIPSGAGLAANKTVLFKGGVLARTIEIPGDIPGDADTKFTIGVEEVVVQLLLRIRTRTTVGSPEVISDALVQVNKNGAFAVNSWSVQ
ncbi:MAG TPA: hypothetical protein PLV68_06570, partial [Ilumatobacteraceae bacterium]|nr:hypothetical protein [Ilumatobacteraceae bacterium]